MSSLEITEELPLPVSLDEAKAAARIDHDDEDTLLSAYLAAAIEQLETSSRTSIRPKSIIWYRERFDDEMLLAYSPVRAVASVEYIQDGAAPAALVEDTDYRTNLYARPARVLRIAGVAWPRIDRRHDAVRITYSAGYLVGTLPARIKAAVLQLTTHLYETREPVELSAIVRLVPEGLGELLGGFALPEVG